MPKPDAIGETIYSWMQRHSDADGNVEYPCTHIAEVMGKPLSTIQHAMTRLQGKGRVVSLNPHHFIVVKISDPEWAEAHGID